MQSLDKSVSSIMHCKVLPHLQEAEETKYYLTISIIDFVFKIV